MAAKLIQPNAPATQDNDSVVAQRSRPCDCCRRRKSRCVVEDSNSTCVLCKFHGQQCTYNEAVQPRKRSLKLANQASPPSPSPWRPGGNLIILPATLELPSASSSKRRRTIFIAPGTGVEEYDTLPGPSLLKHTLGLQNSYHSEYLGPNSIPDVYDPRALQPSDSSTACYTVRFVHPSHAFRIISDSDTEGYEEEQTAADEIEATALPYGPDLVHLYFRIVHPSFPILHKDVFLEKYARSYREFSPPLLAAVYLLASTYWSYDEKLSLKPKIDTTLLERLAFAALQNTMRRPKLSSIQAGLLLSQWQRTFIDMRNEQRNRLTWQLVHLSHALGIHIDCSHWDIPGWEIGLRRRIGWALYIQDKWTALLDSRPPLISNDDWDVGELSEYDFPEKEEDDQEGSSEVQRGRMVFMYMSHLSEILAEILKAVFSAKSRKSLDIAPDRLGRLLQVIKPLQIQLKHWFSTLPEPLKMDTVASMKLSSVGYLRLAYLTTEVCIHRAILRTLVMTEDPDLTVSQVCRSAANERFANAADFISRLQAQHLHSFWYATSAKCCALVYSFGQILASAAQNEDENAMYSRKLKEFKWALKVNGEAGADFMKNALTIIGYPIRAVTPAAVSSIGKNPDTLALWMQGEYGRSNGQQGQPLIASPLSQVLGQESQYGEMPGTEMTYDDFLDEFADPDAMLGGLASEPGGAWLQAEAGMDS